MFNAKKKDTMSVHNAVSGFCNKQKEQFFKNSYEMDPETIDPICKQDLETSAFERTAKPVKIIILRPYSICQRIQQVIFFNS